MSNVVTLTNLSEVSHAQLLALARQFGTVWLARYVPVMRGAVLVYSRAEEAAQCQAALHGTAVFDNSTLVTASLSTRAVSAQEAADFQLAAPKRVVQLVSPPPSPPDWWNGWNDVEEGPKPPPTLIMHQSPTLAHKPEHSVSQQLRLVAANLFALVEHDRETQGPNKNDDSEDDRPRVPTITIQAPPESLTGIPEGFVVVDDKNTPVAITNNNNK
jgi:hypothetical protein